MRTFLLLLATLLPVAPAGADSAFPGPAYPERGGEGGAAAPGMIGDAFTQETLHYWYSLSDIPFPLEIEPEDGWTNIYCSATDAGNWDAGDDGASGLTPELAQKTLSVCKATALSQPYGRIVLDHETFCVDQYDTAGDGYTDTNPGTETYEFDFEDTGATLGRDTITRSEGSFVDDDFQPGQEITVTGTASNNTTFIVQEVTELVLTLNTIGNDATDEGPTASNSGPLAISIDHAQAQGSPDGDCDHDGSTAGAGYGDGMGLVEDSDTEPGTERTDLAFALENPLWWLWCPPGGACTIDQRGYTGTEPCLTWGVDDERSQLLVSGSLSIECANNASGAGVPIDSEWEGIIRYVGDGSLRVHGAVGGSSNVISAHEFSVSDAYGDFTMAFANTSCTDGSSSSPIVATNGIGAISLHSANQISAHSCSGASLVSVSQVGGESFANLSSEQQTRMGQGAARVSTSGQRLTLPATQTTDISEVVNLAPSALEGRPNHVEYLSFSNFFDNQGEGDFPNHIEANPVAAGARIVSRLIYPTFGSIPAISGRYMIIPGAFDDTDVWDIHVAGWVMEEGGGEFKAATGVTAVNQFIRITDPSWADGASVARFVDGIYRSADADPWRIDVTGAPSDQCPDATLEDLASCVNGQSPGSIEISNNTNISTAESGTATGASTVSRVVKSGGGLTADAFIGGILMTTGGTGDDQARRITDNDTAGFDVSPDFDISPDATTTYVVTMYVDAQGRCQLEDANDCEDHVAGGVSDYNATLEQRQYCPSYICGTTGRRYIGQPSVWNDAGRQRPDPWVAR